jgi:hypothetical protein
MISDNYFNIKNNLFHCIIISASICFSSCFFVASLCPPPPLTLPPAALLGPLAMPPQPMEMDDMNEMGGGEREESRGTITFYGFYFGILISTESKNQFF